MTILTILTEMVLCRGGGRGALKCVKHPDASQELAIAFVDYWFSRGLILFVKLGPHWAFRLQLTCFLDYKLQEKALETSPDSSIKCTEILNLDHLIVVLGGFLLDRQNLACDQ